MKTLVSPWADNYHAIINSNTYCMYAAPDKPVWHDEKSGLAETENIIRDVDIYEQDKDGNVKMMRIPIGVFKEVMKNVIAILEEKTEPDFPEY